VMLATWAMLICCVTAGSLLPATSSVLAAASLLPVNDKTLHFGAYLLLSTMPVIAFRERRRGIIAGLSMFLLGLVLEAAQHFSPGRSAELGDAMANGAGVCAGALLGLPVRRWIQTPLTGHRDGGP
jgi:VanZ family protein